MSGPGTKAVGLGGPNGGAVLRTHLPRVTAASRSPATAVRRSGNVTHPTSGPPHHGQVRWSPQPSAKARLPNTALQALQAFREHAFVCADPRTTMTICTFLKHTLSDPPPSQGTEPFSHPRAPSRCCPGSTRRLCSECCLLRLLLFSHCTSVKSHCTYPFCLLLSFKLSQ